MLKVKQIKSIAATSGIEAIKILENQISNTLFRREKMFKIVILDYEMPEMDGPAVARKIVKMFSGDVLQSELPFICCCSAYTRNDYKNKAIKAGMNHFLTKPISIRDLEELLKLLQ